ncbi:alpha/beta fold hydrolase [Bacillus sp. MRMR6]|uniref:alpha/beta fold hydrolase n=1 Tax=Bacillus sp. MRMR6 TaxID=1928617 RepID=UPI0009531BF3|nr:alpha/beta hydrolase [Bacillus sp. MRMR6]OLS40377.1 alpha/beta hydrolase [Bacillus sp. MRMR6]
MPMLDVGGISMYYSIKGEGVPIVFIHPPLLTSANFHYQEKQLSHTNQVITFDIRGHGRSHRSEKPLSYSLIAEDIIQLLDHLKIKKAFICGYSTGGSIALEFMLRHAERSYGGIIISGMSEASDLYLRQKISLARKLTSLSSVKLLARAIAWGNSQTKETFNLLYDEAIKGDTQNIGQYYEYSLQYNCTNQLKNIHLPNLLLYGSKDKLFHRYAKLLHQNLPNSKLKYLIKEKHQLPTKASDELNQLITHFVQVNSKQTQT